MSRFRAFINPFDDSGNFTGFVEVTEDVDFNSTSSIKQQIDNDEFNVGVFKFGDFGLKLRNETGKYSDVTIPESMFRFRRAGSQFKLTWDPADEVAQCGLAIAGASMGAQIGEQIQVIIGVLSDTASKLDIDDQKVSFKVLSSDAVFSSVEAPFSSLSAGQLYSDALLTILNLADITKYLTISASNINVSLDQTLDVIAQYENQTVKEVLDDLLFQSNSVLYIEDETVFIKSRDGGATSVFTFRGQASNEGIENIKNISDISTGARQVFNFWTWKDTTLLSQDVSSIDNNGVRKKEIEFDAITTGSKRQAILDALKFEFRTKKQIFDITTPLSPDVLGISMLDQVRVDYPTIYQPADVGGELPIYGAAIYGESIYGFGQFSITISQDTPFKVLGINVNVKSQEVKFKLKEI